MKNKLLTALLLLASLQTMATLTDAAAASSSKHVKIGSTNTGFMDLPDELVGLILNQCSAGAQKALRAVNHNCATLYSEMTEKRSVIINMNKVNHLTQQGRSLSELYALLNQAHVIEIRNATFANFPALLPHMAQVTQLTVKINESEPDQNRLPIIQAIAQSQHMSKLTALDLLFNNIGPAAKAAVKKRFPFAEL